MNRENPLWENGYIKSFEEMTVEWAIWKKINSFTLQDPQVWIDYSSSWDSLIVVFTPTVDLWANVGIECFRSKIIKEARSKWMPPQYSIESFFILRRELSDIARSQYKHLVLKFVEIEIDSQTKVLWLLRSQKYINRSNLLQLKQALDLIQKDGFDFWLTELDDNSTGAIRFKLDLTKSQYNPWFIEKIQIKFQKIIDRW